MKMSRGENVADCPRCGEFSIREPEVLNALSRTTRGVDDIPVYVCSACGSDEGMLEYFNIDGCQPQSEWPVKREFSTEFQNRYWEDKTRLDKIRDAVQGS